MSPIHRKRLRPGCFRPVAADSETIGQLVGIRKISHASPIGQQLAIHIQGAARGRVGQRNLIPFIGIPGDVCG